LFQEEQDFEQGPANDSLLPALVRETCLVAKRARRKWPNNW